MAEVGVFVNHHTRKGTCGRDLAAPVAGVVVEMPGSWWRCQCLNVVGLTDLLWDYIDLQDRFRLYICLCLHHLSWSFHNLQWAASRNTCADR